MGWRIPPARLTLGAYWVAFKHVFAPVLGALAAVDIILYFIFKYIFNSCYGVMCML